MTTHIGMRWNWFLALLLAAMLPALPLVPAAPWGAGNQLRAQEATPEPGPKGDQPAAGEATRKPPRGRLPAYYSRVVSEVQREKIYAIQARFASQLADLQKQIQALEMERDQEVAGVLTPEQQQRVAEMAAQARSRRADRKADGPSPAENGPAPDATPAPQ